MRKIILRLLILAVAIWIILSFIPGIIFDGNVFDFIKIVGVIFVLNLLVKPLIKMLALPIEVATLGLVSVLFDAVVLWLISLWLHTLQINAFWFSGLSASFFIIAPFQVPAIITLLIAASLLSLISTILFWLTK